MSGYRCSRLGNIELTPTVRGSKRVFSGAYAGYALLEPAAYEGQIATAQQDEARRFSAPARWSHGVPVTNIADATARNKRSNLRPTYCGRRRCPRAPAVLGGLDIAQRPTVPPCTPWIGIALVFAAASFMCVAWAASASTAPEEGVWSDRWPPNRAGLVFLWEHSDATNEVFDPVRRETVYCTGVLRGRAIFDRYYGLDLAGGAFVAEGANERLLSACQETNALSLEVVFTSDDAEQTGPARIVIFSSGPRSRNFTLGQDRDELVFALRTESVGPNGTDPPLRLARIEAGRPYHLIVNYRPGEMIVYLDGREAFSTREIAGGLSNWSAQHLSFGSEWGGKWGWRGRLEGIALHNRVIPAEEARRRHALYAEKLNERVPAQRYTVRAQLDGISPTPAAARLREYSRALVVYAYDVLEVLQGEVEADRILVAHWAYLDREPVRALRGRRVGDEYRLRLERFDENPQLESERQFNAIDDFALPFFYDVSSPR